MQDVNWWLMALAVVLGLALTFGLMIRRVTREVPTFESLRVRSSGLDGAPRWKAAPTRPVALAAAVGSPAARWPARMGRQARLNAG